MNYVNNDKLKFKSDILKSSNQCIFYNFLQFSTFSIIFFHILKISKHLSASYYQENKERLQRKASERYQILSKQEKEKK